MALANFSLPYQLATPSPFLYGGNEGRSIINNLRLNAVLPPPPPPTPTFGDETQYQNDPYIRYQQPQQQQQRFRQGPQPQRQEIFTGVTSSHSSARSFSSQDTRYSGYDQDFRRTQLRQDQQQRPEPPSLQQQPQLQRKQQQEQLLQQQRQQITEQQQRVPVQQDRDQLQSPTDSRDKAQENYPERPNGYTRVNSGSYTGPGAKTSVHAVLDYDDDEFEDYYEDENPEIPSDAHVTPIQGPIFLKNGSVPVVPLYSYPQLNNGTLVQIPILWTALSVALGVELRGDLIRGAPCIKKYHQLFCPTAGNSYPIERIELFIDENKALMKRMYGDFEMNEFAPPRRDPTNRRKRTATNHDIPDGGPKFWDDLKFDPHSGSGDSYFSKIRKPRQSLGKAHNANDSGRVDACESKVEIVTPYWSTNSAGKVRAIVNTQHFEQAIHQEVCSKTQTNRCAGDCGCEQKYKWHRLLAYDPDNDCKGIFMDWFLYPSCCICRCDPNAKFPGTTTTNRN